MARNDTPLVDRRHQLSSRLFVGTGKYRNCEEMNAAFDASGTNLITVALRRIDFDDPKSRSVLEDVDWKRYQILPNTAGCQTAEEAIRIARMARAHGSVGLDQAGGDPRSQVSAPRSDRNTGSRPRC